MRKTVLKGDVNPEIFSKSKLIFVHDCKVKSEK